MFSRSSATITRLIVVLAVLAIVSANELPGAQAGNNRKLLQWSSSSRASQRMANNMRASVATSQAIENAVNNGGSMASTRRAGATGSLMSWAAAQEDQRVFNVAERFARTANTGR